MCCIAAMFDECFTGECTSATILQKSLIFLMQLRKKLIHLFASCVSDVGQGQVRTASFGC